MTVPSVVRAYPSSGTLGAANRTITTSIDTTGLGSDGAAIVAFSFQGRVGGSQAVTGASVSACTIDGVALSVIRALTINAGSNSASAAMYGILNPAANATASLVVTITGDSVGTPGLTVEVILLQDVSAFGNNVLYNDDSGSTGNATVTVTAAANALAVAAGFHGDTISGVGASTTIAGVANNLDNTSAGGCGIAGTRTGAGGGTALTFNSSVTDHWTIPAVEVIGSGALPAAVPAYVKEVGFVTNTTAGTTSAITVATGGVPVGDVIVIYGACDNTGTLGAATTISVVDNSSQSGAANTYTLQTPQALADPGAASAGCQGFFVVCQVTRALLAADTITITYGNSTTAKAINAQQFTNIRTVTPVLAGSYAHTDNQTTTASSVSTTPDVAGQIVCALVAVEGGTADTYTEDADTTNGSWVTLTRRGSGTTTSGSTLNSVYKIVTAAGAQTYNPTLGTARDSCTAALVLAGPVTDVPIRSRSLGLKVR